MLKLFKTLIAYGIYALIVGELIVRLFSLSSDVPQRVITKDGIQKYLPNQKGSFGKGTHDWQINERGWAGELPKNYNNLITIIGDSFIENFMNPDACHQSMYLKSALPEFNFLEAGRSGVSFIESLEISKHLDSLNPKIQLIYLGDYDIEESIANISKKPDITQLDLSNSTIINGKLKAPLLKKILYNWKFMYYLYSKFPLDFNKKKKPKKDSEPVIKPVMIPSIEKHNEAFEKLVKYAAENYKVDDKILILKPVSTKKLEGLLRKYGFNVILLDNQQDEWTFVYDRHWTCFGHEEASKQIAKKISSQNLKP